MSSLCTLLYQIGIIFNFFLLFYCSALFKNLLYVYLGECWFETDGGNVILPHEMPRSVARKITSFNYDKFSRSVRTNSVSRIVIEITSSCQLRFRQCTSETFGKVNSIISVAFIYLLQVVTFKYLFFLLSFRNRFYLHYCYSTGCTMLGAFRMYLLYVWFLSLLIGTLKK